MITKNSLFDSCNEKTKRLYYGQSLLGITASISLLSVLTENSTGGLLAFRSNEKTDKTELTKSTSYFILDLKFRFAQTCATLIFKLQIDFKIDMFLYKYGLY